jgi:hypothetical protein
MRPVDYNDDLHQYSFRSVPYISVTQLLHTVVNEFNTDEESRGMAERHGHSHKYWKKKWKKITDDSLVIGDNLHKIQEEFALTRGIDLVRGQEVRVYNYDLMAHRMGYEYEYWPDGVYTEMMLWNHPNRLAGRADKVYLYTDLEGVRVADIDDHKSNKRMRRTSWYDKDTGLYRMMKPPLDHLMDCELLRYTLQLSFYQFMLEAWGFKPGRRRILHYEPLPDDMGEPGQRSSRPTVYELDYLRDEVITLLKHREWEERYST